MEAPATGAVSFRGSQPAKETGQGEGRNSPEYYSQSKPARVADRYRYAGHSPWEGDKLRLGAALSVYIGNIVSGVITPVLD
jgi:hypothetical protein